jgi:hypothetical protein
MKKVTIFLGVIAGGVLGVLCRRLVSHLVWPGGGPEHEGWFWLPLTLVTAAFLIAGGFLGRSVYDRLSGHR